MDNKLLFAGLNCLDCKGFKQLLDTQSLVDCTLACEGGKISAHKVVLSACSSYLAKILLEHPVEHPIIILPELNIEDVRTLVHYMYTGELLKSSTINSISLLRTAALLSINSLNDLLLSSSSSSSPNNVINSYQFPNANATNNSLMCSPALIQLQDRMSIVDQISPLLAAISQHQQQQQQQHKFDLSQNQSQSFGANFTNNGFGSLSVNQNENIWRNLSASSHDSNSSSNSSNFSNIIGAAASINGSENPAVTCAGNSAMTQIYNSLRGAITTNSVNLNTSSSSSTSPSPQSNKPNFSVPEPFSYSSAITGMVTVTNANTDTNNSDNNNSSSNSNNNDNLSGSQSTTTTNITTNEFQFKCPVCQNHFQTICSFEYHMQRAHSVTSFGCEICHKPFASLRYVLTDHMRRCHGWKGATNTVASNGQSNQSSSENNEHEQQQQQKLQC